MKTTNITALIVRVIHFLKTAFISSICFKEKNNSKIQELNKEPNFFYFVFDTEKTNGSTKSLL